MPIYDMDYRRFGWKIVHLQGVIFAFENVLTGFRFGIEVDQLYMMVSNISEEKKSFVYGRLASYDRTSKRYRLVIYICGRYSGQVYLDGEYTDFVLRRHHDLLPLSRFPIED